MPVSKVKAEEEQAEMFPELDTSNPKHKELMRRAKAYVKFAAARKELLDDNKAKEDELAESLISAMHGCELTKFRHDGVTVDLKLKEKVSVKIDTSDGEEEDGE